MQRFLILLLLMATRTAAAAEPGETLAPVQRAIVGIEVAEARPAPEFRRNVLVGGSGWLVENDQGATWIVTLADLCAPRGVKKVEIEVILPGATNDEEPARVAAQVVREEGGLALLSVKSKEKRGGLSLGATKGLRETSRVVLAGCVRDEENPVNPIVSIERGALSSIRTDDQNRVVLLEMEGKVTPGLAGGPLLDDEGKVLGVIAAKVPTTELGVAVPVEKVAELLRAYQSDREFASAHDGVLPRDWELAKVKQATLRLKLTFTDQFMGTTSKVELEQPAVLVAKNEKYGFLVTAGRISSQEPKFEQCEAVLYSGTPKAVSLDAQLFATTVPRKKVYDSLDLPRSEAPLPGIVLLRAPAEGLPEPIDAVACESASHLDVVGFAERPLRNYNYRRPEWRAEIERIFIREAVRDDQKRIAALAIDEGINDSLKTRHAGGAVVNHRGQPVGLALVNFGNFAHVIPLTEVQAMLRGHVEYFNVEHDATATDEFVYKVTGQAFDPLGGLKSVKLLISTTNTDPRARPSAGSGYQRQADDMQTIETTIDKDHRFTATIRLPRNDGPPEQPRRSLQRITCQTLCLRSDDSEYIGPPVIITGRFKGLATQPLPEPIAERNNAKWREQLEENSLQLVRYAKEIAPAEPPRYPLKRTTHGKEGSEEGTVVQLTLNERCFAGTYSAKGDRFFAVSVEGSILQFELPSWKQSQELRLNTRLDASHAWWAKEGLAVALPNQIVVFDPETLEPIQRTYRFQDSLVAGVPGDNRAWMLLPGSGVNSVAKGEFSAGLARVDLGSGKIEQAWQWSQLLARAPEKARALATKLTRLSPELRNHNPLLRSDSDLAAATHLAISPDGKVLVAAAGHLLLRFRVEPEDLILEDICEMAVSDRRSAKAIIASLRFRYDSEKLAVTVVELSSKENMVTTAIFSVRDFIRPLQTIDLKGQTGSFAFHPTQTIMLTQYRDAPLVLLDEAGEIRKQVRFNTQTHHTNKLTMVMHPEGKEVVLLGNSYLFYHTLKSDRSRLGEQ